MYIIEPQTLNLFQFYAPLPPQTYSLSVPENKGGWLSGSNYSKGDLVSTVYEYTRANGSENNYVVWLESRVDDNIGNSPLDNPIHWKQVAPDNQTAFLDRYINSQIVSNECEEIKIKVQADVVDTIALMNVSAKYVELSYDGQVQELRDLREDTAVWSTEYPDELYKETVVFQVSTSQNKDYTIRLLNDTTSPTGIVGLGKLIMGKSRYIGQLIGTPEVGRLDYSQTTQDETGYLYLHKGLNVRTCTHQVILKAGSENLIERYLTKMIGTPALFVGLYEVGNEMLTNYAIYKDYNITLNGTDHLLELELQGLV